MKHLMKISIAVIIFSMTTQSFAQTFGIKGGLNLSNMVWDYGDTTGNYSMQPGFHVGATAEFPISDMFAVETGLLLSTKGCKFSEDFDIPGASASLKGNMILYYIDIPITAKASFNVGSAKIYGALGPYLGFGLSGKTHFEMTSTLLGQTSTLTDDETIQWGSDNEDDLKMFDFGLTAGAGVEINSIQIGVSYGLGIANIEATSCGSKTNNRVLGISVGYKFGSNKSGKR